jgi:hypothetical protein
VGPIHCVCVRVFFKFLLLENQLNQIDGTNRVAIKSQGVEINTMS